MNSERGGRAVGSAAGILFLRAEFRRAIQNASPSWPPQASQCHTSTRSATARRITRRSSIGSPQVGQNGACDWRDRMSFHNLLARVPH
jgi:hypothetical protein